jgi:hypothetical protein
MEMSAEPILGHWPERRNDTGPSHTFYCIGLGLASFKELPTARLRQLGSVAARVSMVIDCHSTFLSVVTT